jgi:hypothetical protein
MINVGVVLLPLMITGSASWPAVASSATAAASVAAALARMMPPPPCRQDRTLLRPLVRHRNRCSGASRL